MGLVEFLTRIHAGKFFILTWSQAGGGGFTSRAWEASPSAFDEVAGFVRTLVRNGAEVYHALGSYKDATLNQRGVLQARRTQENVQFLKVLVADADVHREGDGKDSAKVFPDRDAAVAWMENFCAQTSMPKPNLAVNSGYGVHWYWVLVDALPPAWWQPLAAGLVTAMRAHGWTGDTAPTIDSARILRPPGTANFKAGRDQPAPVEVLDAYTAPDHANDVIFHALEQYIGQGTGTYGAGTTARSGTVLSLTTRPAHIPGPGEGPQLNEAAHEGIEHRDFFFEQIAEKCLQVKQSLAVGGKGDSRDLWRRFLHLAYFTKDGAEYAHKIGEGDPRYTHEGTEREYKQVGDEITRKGLGAPRCVRLDLDRPGVCGGCPFWGKINSPISTGSPDGDLPPGYRRNLHRGWPQIEYLKENDWFKLLDGNVYLPQVNRLPIGGFELAFSYELGGGVEDIVFKQVNAADGPTVFRDLEVQGLTLPLKGQKEVVGFLMAWITEIRKMAHVHRDIQLRPFGWNFDEHSELLGLSIAGDHYRCDGSVTKVPGGDPKLNMSYTPIGTLEKWREAASLFEGGRPDLQAIIATSFASPLFRLAGDIRGMCFNFWSIESGIGKTSALKVGQAVWGDVNAISNLNDTPNAVMKLLSAPRVLNRYWDELRLPTPERVLAFVDMVYAVPQGREKARMQSDTTLRETGEWDCAVVFTSNRSQMDHLLANNEGTDSGMQRLFEIYMPKEERAFDAAAGQKMKHLETNYGHAGRLYAQWIAANASLVERLLAHVSDGLNNLLRFQREERFFNTAMTTTLCGALIAQKLDLFAFDVEGIRDCMIKHFLALREQLVERTAIATTGGYRVEDMIAQFMADQADYRVRTNNLASHNTAGVRVLGKPSRNEVRYQIAEAEQPSPMLRISRPALFKWLGLKQIPTRKFLEQLVADMNARVGKKTLAGGTEYASGQLWCVDVPMLGGLAAAGIGLGDIGKTASPNN